jgi:hypothetical protein
MLITFKDSQEATKNSFKEYAEGVYQVKVIKATDGTANSGTEYLEIEFETMGEDVFKVRNRFYKSPKALSILLNFLGAVGIYDKNSKEDLRFENDDLLGSILKVEFVKGEANENGKQYLELKPWSCEAVSGIASPKKVEKRVEDTDDSDPF